MLAHRAHLGENNHYHLQPAPTTQELPPPKVLTTTKNLFWKTDYIAKCKMKTSRNYFVNRYELVRDMGKDVKRHRSFTYFEFSRRGSVEVWN